MANSQGTRCEALDVGNKQGGGGGSGVHEEMHFERTVSACRVRRRRWFTGAL